MERASWKVKSDTYLMSDSQGGYYLDQSPEYYTQVQLQMHVTTQNGAIFECALGKVSLCNTSQATSNVAGEHRMDAIIVLASSNSRMRNLLLTWKR